MGALAGAVSPQELFATYDCSSWSCTGEAPSAGALCSYCEAACPARRRPPRLVDLVDVVARETRSPGRMERVHLRIVRELDRGRPGR